MDKPGSVTSSSELLGNHLPLLTSNRPRIPIANTRNVFNMHDVEKKLAKLPEKDHDSLRSMYERMLERGPERFQVKPSGLPEMEELYVSLPNFTDPLDDMRRSIALGLDSSDGLDVVPMLLLGPPGVGKTHFAKKIADLLGTGMNLVPMSSMTAGWLLSGSSSQWKGAKPGKVFEALVDGQYANPVIVVDEVDKAGSQAQYDPLGALYSLLEHDTAATFTDEFAEVPVDASRIIWVLTANDERAIPEPIMNRMNVYEIETPTFEQSRKIANILYREIRACHGWGKDFEEEPNSGLLDCLARIGPRDMRLMLMKAFGNAKLDNRATVSANDLPKEGNKKRGPGFLSH